MVSLTEVRGKLSQISIESILPKPPSETRTRSKKFDAGLTREQLDEFGRELDAIRAKVIADLGDRDRNHIYRVVKVQRGLETAGRALFYLGFLPPAWMAAVTCLALSKSIDNLEVGHNVMHGQYDWMREKGFNSRAYEWDMVVDGDAWRYSHNFRHHTFTNIVGLDRDVGFGVMRLEEEQPWHPSHLANPVVAALGVLFFEWLATLHVLELDVRLAAGDTPKEIAAQWWSKVWPQVLKDYVFFPALTGPLFPLTFAGNALANILRNMLVGTLVYCGHFPAEAQSFTIDETREETRGEWYLRQLVGSSNFESGRLFQIVTGGTGNQIEHHLFPDIPSSRYPELAVEVRRICAKYGLPYNTGRFSRQVFACWKRIFRLALP